MKTNQRLSRIIAFGTVLIVAAFCNYASAQTDTTKVVQPDTTLQPQVVTQPETASQTTGENDEDVKKKDHKRKDEFVLYAGANFSQLGVNESDFESTNEVGYHLGGYYKRGKFFYWQAGLRFASASYGLNSLASANDSINDFSVSSLDIPLSAGVNLLSATNRVLALRLFVSADPTINLGIGDNNFGLEKDDLNSFILNGQGGLGVNVAFMVIEVGYNYGLQDLFKDIESKPGQVFVNVGFRF